MTVKRMLFSSCGHSAVGLRDCAAKRRSINFVCERTVQNRGHCKVVTSEQITQIDTSRDNRVGNNIHSAAVTALNL